MPEHTDNIIPVIDIFAGPGGLGEGFSSVLTKDNKNTYKIALSIEKDEFAHKTLTLRSFYRQFNLHNIPPEYYEYLKGNITEIDLYARYPKETIAAKNEAWKATLGKTPEKDIDGKIKLALGNKKSWVLIGGPPCQAYSIVGRARKQLKDNIDDKDERVYLYREYYRILAVHNPPIFVMENVKGLLSSRLNEKLIFKQILDDLENPAAAYKKLRGRDPIKTSCPGYYLYSLVKNTNGYDLNNRPTFKPEDFIIRTENYGVPQARHRVIILGIRKDFKTTEPGILSNIEAIPIKKVLCGLPRLRSGISKADDTGEKWIEAIKEILSNNYLKDINVDVINEIKNIVKNLKIPRIGRGFDYISYDVGVEYQKKWYLDKKLKGVCNHSTRAHIKKDLLRYMFAACYSKIINVSPRLDDFPEKLLPNHKNAKGGKFNDRFRVQLLNEPSKTITSHISKDGHYYIHPDPTQCRSLTVREAARIQTFPDNYHFSGPRTSQYIQVGNAVPPYLAYQIAKIIQNLLI